MSWQICSNMSCVLLVLLYGTFSWYCRLYCFVWRMFICLFVYRWMWFILESTNATNMKSSVELSSELESAVPPLGSQRSRFAALAERCKAWEDDLTHHSFKCVFKQLNVVAILGCFSTIETCSFSIGCFVCLWPTLGSANGVFLLVLWFAGCFGIYFCGKWDLIW